MYLLNLSSDVFSGGPDLSDIATWQCEEITVADDLGTLDGAVNVVADIGSDASDIPPFTEALIGDVDVDRSFMFDEHLYSVDHMKVTARISGLHPVGDLSRWSDPI